MNQIVSTLTTIINTREPNVRLVDILKFGQFAECEIKNIAMGLNELSEMDDIEEVDIKLMFIKIGCVRGIEIVAKTKADLVKSKAERDIKVEKLKTNTNVFIIDHDKE